VIDMAHKGLDTATAARNAPGLFPGIPDRRQGRRAHPAARGARGAGPPDSCPHSDIPRMTFAQAAAVRNRVLSQGGWSAI
jgi:hypothetical protein